MNGPEDVLARCEGLRAGAAGAAAADVAWLIGCFDHPLKVVQRTAGDTLVALAAAGIDVAGAIERAVLTGSFRRRWVAAWTASRLPVSRSPAQEDVLLEALGTDDGDVRWAAARILSGGTRTTDLVPHLLALATAGNDEQRKMAVYCLRDLGRTDAASLARYRAALDDSCPGVRLAGMSALQRAGGGEAADARRIARLLDDDPDGGVRRAAAATLGRLGVGDAEVRKRLARASASEDAVLARTARAALGRLLA
jgi:HEAT repeat protein